MGESQEIILIGFEHIKRKRIEIKGKINENESQNLI